KELRQKCEGSRCWGCDSLCCWDRCCLSQPRQGNPRPRALYCLLAIAPMLPIIAIVTTAAGAIGTAMGGVAGSTTIDIIATATITGGRLPGSVEGIEVWS